MNKLFLLLFLLSFSTTMQSMKRLSSEIVNIQSKTLYAKAEKISIFISKGYGDKMNLFFFQENHNFALREMANSYNREKAKKFTFHGYSYLGLVAMSIKVYPSQMPIDNYPEQASFIQKKTFIDILKKANFLPTPKDRKIAFLEKWERCKSIIKNICFFRYAYSISEILPELLIPQEVINDISLLMFETEESLL